MSRSGPTHRAIGSFAGSRSRRIAFLPDRRSVAAAAAMPTRRSAHLVVAPIHGTGAACAASAAPGSNPSMSAIAPADGDGFAPVRFNPSGSPAVQLLAGVNAGTGAASARSGCTCRTRWRGPSPLQVRFTDRAGSELDATVGLAAGRTAHADRAAAADAAEALGHDCGPADSLAAGQGTGGGGAHHHRPSGPPPDRRIAIAMPRPPTPADRADRQDLHRSRAAAGRSAGTPRLYAIVDAYGQYSRGEWDEKYRAASDPGAGADPATALPRSRDRAGARAEGAPSPPTHRPCRAAPPNRRISRRRWRGRWRSLDDYRRLCAASSVSAPQAVAGTKGFFRTAKVRDARGHGLAGCSSPPLGNPFFSLGRQRDPARQQRDLRRGARVHVRSAAAGGRSAGALPGTRTAPMPCRSTPARSAAAASARAGPTTSTAPTSTAAMATDFAAQWLARIARSPEALELQHHRQLERCGGQPGRANPVHPHDPCRGRLQQALRRQGLVGRHCRPLRSALRRKRWSVRSQEKRAPARTIPT